MAWKLAEAKNKFSEVVRRALTEGPQTIERRGERVVMLSEVQFEKLTKKPRAKDFKQHLLSIPSLEGVDLRRDKSPGRNIKF